MKEGGHPIEVDLERILPILAREIYTSPFAFLRENVQNAFDAVRLQTFREQSLGLSRKHRISIVLQDNKVTISDSGIGMTKGDLASFFWSIGKSGKHTAEAKSAGVVGTFGIGGMANFGVCSRLEVTTRTHDSSTSITSFADRNNLSAKEDCVFYETGPIDFPPGTAVTGTLMQPITVQQIVAYLKPIVQFIDVPVRIGDQLLSQAPFPTVKRDEGAAYTVKSGPVKASVWIRALQNGQAEVAVDQLKWNEVETEISAVFSTTISGIAAYQHGFMLAAVPVTSVFGFGGIINSSVLRPTAGREAVTDESRTLVQQLLGAIEHGVATHISKTAGLPERFSSFYRYISQNSLWILAGSATVRLYGTNSRTQLDALKSSPKDKVYFLREGHDQSIAQAYAEQGKTLVLLSSDGFRQRAESNYLLSYCNAAELEDRVTCVRTIDRLTFAQETFKYQLIDRLRRQFLIDGLHVKAGELSHGAMLWTPPQRSVKERTLFVDFRHAHIKRLVELRESLSFDAVFDIFIRDSVLPHLEGVFPDLRKRDFDALLRKLQSSVEYFEIDPGDVGRIEQLASITKMSPEAVAAVFGGRRASTPRSTSVQQSDVVAVPGQVNQVAQQAVAQQSSGKPIDEIRREMAIKLLETALDAKILDATDVPPQLGLAHYYLALTADAHVLYRRVFLERKPATDFSWGGHRAGYLFYSQGSAVVYYDIQFEDLIGETEKHERTGMFTMQHEPLVLQNQVFLPIPEQFEREMVPVDRPLKFTIRHQILGVGNEGDWEL
jgi:molecular chaperone HtpG